HMNLEDIRYGQRIRVHVPGIGDDGQVGTITRVRDTRCFVHLDWDQRPRRTVVFYAVDLERLPDQPGRPRATVRGAERST
ncbi:MAG TPA: hypothetical protein VFZ66_25075, partial [Herpetosiphonaceae bacterium]